MKTRFVILLIAMVTLSGCFRTFERIIRTATIIEEIDKATEDQAQSADSLVTGTDSSGTAISQPFIGVDFDTAATVVDSASTVTKPDSL